MNQATSNILQVKDLGVMLYAEAFAYQKKIHAQVIEGSAPDTLLLVEHEPVITISRRKAASENLLADEKTLAAIGIDVQQTDRGGDVTYHGPGQLVVYPIVRLQRLRMNVGRYVRMLEELIIDVLDSFGVQGKRVEGCTGVWVDTDGSQSKIGAIGVRVSRNVSLHGFALNVSTNLSHFETIIPCGLQNSRVISLRALLGADSPDMAQVKEQVIIAAQARFGGERQVV